LTEHQGYEKHAADGRGSDNSRTGTSAKTLKTEQGDLPLEIPRDRRGDLEPQLVAKGQRRSGVLDEKIIVLYGRGLTVSDIQAHLEEMYETNELKKPRRRGPFHRLRRWVQWLSRSRRSRFPPSPGPVVHRPHGPQQLALCPL